MFARKWQRGDFTEAAMMDPKLAKVLFTEDGMFRPLGLQHFAKMRTGWREVFTVEGAVHIDTLLSNFAVNYLDLQDQAIAAMFMPVIPVPFQTGGYPIWSQADLWKLEDDYRAPGTEANQIAARVTSATYHCKPYALKSRMPIEVSQNADPAIALMLQDQNRARMILNKLLLSMEVRVSCLTFNTANVGSNAAVASAWNDATTGHSNPMGDLNTAIDNVQNATGFKPNEFIMGINAWKACRRHADVVTKSTNPNYLAGGNYPNVLQVAQLFEMEAIYVGGQQINTAQGGAAYSGARIWGSSALVCFNERAPAIDVPTFCAAFEWQGGPVPNWAVRRFPYEDKTDAQELQIGYYRDEKVVSAPLGFLLTGVSSIT